MLRQHPRVLLRVERVAFRALQHGLLSLGVEDGAVQQALQELGRLLVRQRADRQRERVSLSATPPGTPVEQLGSSGCDDQHGNGRRPVGEVVDEVE